MDDAIGVVIIPLILSIIGIIVEYFIVQPLQALRQQRLGRPSTNNFRVVNIFLLPTGVVSFLVIIAIVFAQLQIPKVDVGSIQITIPSIALPISETISDVNISLAALIYTCVALNIVTFRKGPRWASFFTLRILPPVLIVLWSSAFFSEDGFAFFVFLALSNLWVVVPFYRKDMILDTALIVIVLLIPTNALIMIFLGGYDQLGAWLLALFGAFGLFALLSFDPDQTYNEMNNNVESESSEGREEV